MVIGHQKQLQFLTSQVRGNKMAHAYLFSGPDKIGKKKTAFTWFSLFFKEEVDEKKAHPDFSYLAPLEQNGGGEIKIGQVRDFVQKLSLKASRAPFKVGIIDQAHAMNQEAQNCLLKTLEEPFANTLIVLIAQNSDLLLSTIISRCEILKFNFVGRDEVEKGIRQILLQAFEKEDRQTDLNQVLELSAGRPGRAIEFVKDPKAMDFWKKSLADFSKALSSDLAGRFAYAKKIAEEERIEETLEIWQYYFRKELLLKINGSDFNEGKKEAVDAAVPKAVASLKKIDQAIAILSRTNANARLVLENVLLEI